MKGSGKRKWKSLTLKVEHLRLEIEDREEVMDDITKQFMDELSQVADGTEEPPPAPPAPPPPTIIMEDRTEGDPTSQPDLPTREDPEIPDEIKALWKKIAVATHPDKTGGDPEKSELYKRAATAMADGAIDEIVAVAMELGMDLPEASTAAVTRLEKVAGDLEGRLKNIENSVLWQWASAPQKKRDVILAAYMKSKGLKPKKKS
jgi:hypothetical protein